MSSPALKLYTYPNNARAYQALIAAQYVGVNIEVPAFAMGVDNKTPEFLAKNPLGKVPTLETPEGSIFESNAIARYVARLGKDLYGANALEAGQIDGWIDFTSWEINLPKLAWLYPIMGFIPNNVVATNKAKADIRKSMEILNAHLQTRTFLVGNRVSIADIIAVCSVYNLYTTVLDAGFRKSFVNTNRWFNTCVNQPQFKAVLGEVVLCTKMAVAPKPAVAAAPVVEKKEEKKEEKKAPAPKPAKEADDEEDEPLVPAEPKKKSVLDLLPPSKFVLDEWKRTYSNMDTRKEAIPWFWENLDQEGYSIWFADYKYNEENTQLFMVCNLCGGWLQRLDPLRKYGFGTVLVLGSEAPYQVSSCWVFRGQQVPAEMSEGDDYEHHTWRKADLTSEAERELVNDFWAWEGSFGGKNYAVADGKAFK